MTVLELVALTKSVRSPGGGAPMAILDDVSLCVGSGERVGILGRSGSGKSTLLSILGLLETPSSGSYAIDGEDVNGLPARQQDRRRAHTFGFVFQRFCLLDQLTALENVEASLMHSGVRRGARRDRARRALRDVGLADRADHRPGQLSGGEQQRVALARALAPDPAVLLADEPTGALDEDTGAAVMAVMHDLVEARGAALVVVTHDPFIVDGFDRTLHLEHGRTVEP